MHIQLMNHLVHVETKVIHNARLSFIIGFCSQKIIVNPAEVIWGDAGVNATAIKTPARG